MILAAALFFIAWIDHQSKRIPNRILKILLAVRTILLAAEWLTYPKLGLAVLLSALLGAAIGGGMFLIAHFISKGGVGMGDVKLFMVIGLLICQPSAFPAARSYGKREHHDGGVFVGYGQRPLQYRHAAA